MLAGSALSLRVFAADSGVSGVFNSRNFATVSSRPSLTLVAIPEPGTFALCALGFALLGAVRSGRGRRACGCFVLRGPVC